MALRKGENPNHPKKGSSVKVEPIREVRSIKRIKKMLADNPRNLCLFVMGINTAFRAGDLLNLRVGQVRALGIGDDLVVKEEKTGKIRRVTLNKACIEAIFPLLSIYEDSVMRLGAEAKRLGCPFTGNEYLFVGQRGRLSVATVNALVKGWCGDEKLEGNYGSHTLRKTWGYHQRVTFGTAVPLLMEAFGHSTQKQTMEYLCIQPEEIRGIYENEL